MGKYCSDCMYFNPKDKKDNIEGLCKCSKPKDKKKPYTLANQERCEKFMESYTRSSYEKQKLHKAACDIPNKVSGTVEGNLTIAVIVIILVILANIFT